MGLNYSPHVSVIKKTTVICVRNLLSLYAIVASALIALPEEKSTIANHNYVVGLIS